MKNFQPILDNTLTIINTIGDLQHAELDEIDKSLLETATANLEKAKDILTTMKNSKAV